VFASLLYRTPMTASGLTVDQLVDLFASMANVVRPDPIPPTIFGDPDDDQALDGYESASFWRALHENHCNLSLYNSRLNFRRACI
jgi:hypothetical protein